MGYKSEHYCRSCTQTIQLLQGKWKMPILCTIRVAPVRLVRLDRVFPTASKKVLTENLRELEQSGLVVRRDYGEALRHVEYDFNEDVREELNAMLDHLASFASALVMPVNGTSRRILPTS